MSFASFSEGQHPFGFYDQQHQHHPPTPPGKVSITGLPRDITPREFRLLFTFAPEFIGCELVKLPFGDDAPLGTAYFRTYSATINCQVTLDNRSDLVDGHVLKCEIRGSQHSSGTSLRHNSVSGKSRFSFASIPNAPPGSTSLDIQMQNLTMQNGHGYGPEVYGSEVFGPTSPRSLFPNSNSVPELGISRQHISSGKAVLLENSRDDEEFNDMVKAPVSWFSQPHNLQSPPTSTHPCPSMTVCQVQSSAPGSTTSSIISSNTVTLPTSRPNISSSLSQPTTGSTTTHTSVQSEEEEKSTQSSIPTTTPTTTTTSTTTTTTTNTSSSSSSSSSSNLPPTGPASQWSDKRRTSTLRHNNVAISSSNDTVSSSSSTYQTHEHSPELNLSNVVPVPTNSVDDLPSIDASSDPDAASRIVVPYSPTNASTTIQVLQNGGRVLPPANPADQNPPCNTLYVGNLPMNTTEEELMNLFSKQKGYKRLCFRTKMNGPMCFVEFENVMYATKALNELYGKGLKYSVKGGIRLSFSKNPLGVRSSANQNGREKREYNNDYYY